MKQSLGPVVSGADADLLLEAGTVARFEVSASPEDRIRATKKWMIAAMRIEARDRMQQWDWTASAERERQRVADGYYGWGKDGKVLEKDCASRLQQNVQQVADRYVPRSQGRSDHGPDEGHKP